MSAAFKSDYLEYSIVELYVRSIESIRSELVNAQLRNLDISIAFN